VIVRGALTTVLLLGCVDADPAANVRVDASGRAVTFSGAFSAAARNSDGSYSAHLYGSATASITTTWQFGHQRGSNVDQIEGLQPGDDVLLGDPPDATMPIALPDDCTCDSTGAVDLSQVDAIKFTVDYSGITLTTSRAFDFIASDRYVLYSCAEHSWDDVRPLIAAAGCAP
jgi:hypothetical protein